MGKRADALQKEFLLNLKTLREKYDYQRVMANESVKIADTNSRVGEQYYNFGEKHGWDEAIMLLDDLISDWED